MKIAIMVIAILFFLLGLLTLIKYTIAMVKIKDNEAENHKIFWCSAIAIILSLLVMGFSGYFAFFYHF